MALGAGLAVALVEQPYRIACRTAGDVGAAGVLCLAFPLHPPGRPERSRLPELTSVTVPTLVVQGDRDPFGIPDPETLPSAITLVVVSGDHSLKQDAPAIRSAITAWLADVIPACVRQANQLPTTNERSRLAITLDREEVPVGIFEPRDSAAASAG